MKIIPIFETILNELQGVSFEARVWAPIMLSHVKIGRNSKNITINGSDYPKEFKIIRKNILKRDKQKCTICNKNAKIVHHIDYNKDNNLENNLITVCSHCHPKANVNIDYWYAYFKYIIREKGVSNVE